MSAMTAIGQGSIYALGILLMRGLSLITLPLVASQLSLEDFGRQELLVSGTQLGAILLGLGLVEALYRFAPENRWQCSADVVVGTALWLSIAAAALSSALAWPLLSLCSAWWPEGSSATEVMLAAAITAWGSLIYLPLARLRMQGRAWAFFTLTAGRALLQTAFLLLALRLSPSVSSVLTVSLIATLLQVASALFLHLRECPLAWHAPLARGMLRYGLPVMGTWLAAFCITGLDVWLIAYWGSASDVSLYAVAMKFALAVGLLLQPFTLWWYARRMSLLHEAGGVVKNARGAELGCTLGLLSAAAMALLGPHAIDLLLPPAYAAASPLLLPLAFVMALKNAGDMLSLGCFSGESSTPQMWLQWGCALLALLLFCVLIPQQGAMGAVVTLAWVQSIRLALLLFTSQRQLRLPYRYGHLSSFSALSLLLGLGTALFAPSLLASLLCLLLLIACACWMSLIPLTVASSFQRPWRLYRAP